MSETAYMLFWAVGSFLLGGLMFSQMLPKLLLNKNISQDSDDHNPGSFNVFKLCGVPLGSLCLLLDILKGFLPIYFAKQLFPLTDPLFAFIIAAPVLGHCIGVFNHFVGGKCIATAFGTLAALIPETWIILLLAGLYLFFCIFDRRHSMRAKSRTVFTLFGLISCIRFVQTGKISFAIACGLMATIVVYCHRRKGDAAKESPAPLLGKNE